MIDTLLTANCNFTFCSYLSVFHLLFLNLLGMLEVFFPLLFCFVMSVVEDCLHPTRTHLASKVPGNIPLPKWPLTNA